MGDSVALDMLTTMSASTRVDGDDLSAEDAAPFLIGIDVTVENVTDDEIELSFVYDKSETEEAAMQGFVDSMVGLSGTLTTTRNGAYVDGQIDISDADPVLRGGLDQFEQMLADMTVPMPVEPVGLGAQWEMTSASEASGVTFCNAATYRLVEFDGDAYELEVEVAQRVHASDEDDAGFTLTEGFGAGTGGSSGRLSLPIAVSGHSSASTTMVMEFEQDGEKHTQEITFDVDVEVSLRDPED